ncbi:MAG TPA: ArsA-related P-loop ATPase [Kofleriaceae bacterium]|nr:ArsA-related P-loop ATPase [Kofleriaceae bacterium]
MTPLLDRRLLLVTGKGGVGKSTVAGVLGRLAARRGKRVLLDCVGTRAPVVPGVQVAALEGGAALDEYLGRMLPRPLLRRLVKSRLYRRFAAGAPGLGDLMALGKVADDARGGAFDLVIADIGATGHALQMLAMPRAVARAFGGGLVVSEAVRIARELADPDHTALVPVTVPEELAVDEAYEIAARAAALGVALGPVVIDRVNLAPLASRDLPAAPPRAAPLVGEALHRGRAQALRAELDAREIARLGPLAARAVRLPELLVEEMTEAEIERLVEVAGGQL